MTLGLAAVLWLVFVASFNLHEMIVGAGSVALTMAFMYAVARSLGLNLQLRWKDAAQAWRIPWYILFSVTEITWVLIKDVLRIEPAGNLFRVCGFDSSRHDAVRVARTVFAVAYATVAPNFIVIGIDPDQSRMLFHQISARGVSTMVKRLGARG